MSRGAPTAEAVDEDRQRDPQAAQNQGAQGLPRPGVFQVSRI